VQRYHHRQLEHLFAGDHALAGGDRGAEAVEQRRLPGLGPTGDQDVQPGDDGGLEEARRLRGEGAETDQLLEGVCLQDELADVDRHVPAGDVGDHHVQPRAVGQHRIHERGRHVDPPTRGAQHPLHQVGELRGPEDRRRQLGPAVACDEHPARLVDPELLPDV
jgi:hypothetical protein